MNPYPSYGGWGGKRSEVEVILDAKNNNYDQMAWALHKMNQERQQHGGGSGCGCGGGCARCCWTPATSWFDYHRASISYWKDIWDCLYGRVGCPPSGWPPGCGPSPCPPPCPPPDRVAGKLVITVKTGEKAVATFQVVNPTCDTVELEISVDGFRDPMSKQWVSAIPENDKKVLAPGEGRTVNVTVNAGANVPAGKYDGSILIKTPFTKRIELEVQVS